MSTRLVNWTAWVSAGVALWLAAADAAQQGSVDPPEADFLEFLGSWNSGDKHPKWIDPFQLDDPALAGLEHPDEPASPSSRNDVSKRKSTETPAVSPPNPVRPERGVKP